ncbi:MAG: LytTR family DNA-binding domain-containing protein [Mariniphaga sp.]
MSDNILLKQIIKAIVVDDELYAREVLVNYIVEFCTGVEIVGSCSSANEAFKVIVDKEPDLVFLDVDMPNGSGFDLLRMFQSVNFKVVFVTAYNTYATEAFRFAAVDYILKPIKISDLSEAVERVKNSLKVSGSYAQLLDLLESYMSPKKQDKNYVISTASGFSVVKASDIIMFKADSYCTIVYLVDNPPISSSHNLKYYEEIFDPNQFMRVHNSYIINLDHVKKYTIQDEIFLTGNNKSSLSRPHKQDFLDLYKKRF